LHCLITTAYTVLHKITILKGIIMSEYLTKITDILCRIETEEKEKIASASRMVADVIKSDGIIFTFGCGHSHLPGLDAFYRAGGLANVSPMLDTDLMLHNGGAKSSRMEKMSGIAKEIFRRYSIQKNDMLFIFSASGKNAVPIEMALSAKEAGIKTVGISSSSYFNKGASLHLHTDIHIDCKVPYGDACIKVGDATMGGLSTATNCFILNSCLIDGAKISLDEGTVPPIYLSGNIEGGREHNVVLENMYFNRVKHL
jgi:uncharacterized phosphosugar-binding protein